MILGLDVAFRNVGWVLVDPHTFDVTGGGCISTEKSDKKRGIRVADDDVRCCMEIASALAQLIDNNKVKVVVIEVPSGGAKGARALRAMSLVTGVIAAVCELRRVAAVWVTPGDSKKFNTGIRDAGKDVVAASVRVKFPMLSEFLTGKGRDEHICDAAAAVALAEREPVIRMLMRTE